MPQVFKQHPGLPQGYSLSLPKRFWANVNKNGPIPAHCPEPGPCWLWVRARHDFGYGVLWRGDCQEYAHRISWILHFGEIPTDRYVLHKCDGGSLGCVRPDHLFLGTGQDNVDDMWSKNRSTNIGETSVLSKLTADGVRKIRSDYASGIGPKRLAELNGVKVRTI